MVCSCALSSERVLSVGNSVQMNRHKSFRVFAARYRGTKVKVDGRGRSPRHDHLDSFRLQQLLNLEPNGECRLGLPETRWTLRADRWMARVDCDRTAEERRCWVYLRRTADPKRQGSRLPER